VVFLVWFGYFK